jgi:outer membrane protein OmpA-like peptidoglycan-associated protein
MSKNLRVFQVFAGIVLLSASFVSFAQIGGNGVLLKGDQVTKDALINALKIDLSEQQPPAAIEANVTSGPITRGFKLPTATPQPHRVPQAGKASLLITFASDSTKLTKESIGSLDILAEAMQSKALTGGMFSIEGHADPRGDEARNIVLSQQRAQAVLTYLVDQRGIARDKLTATGKGSSELVNTQQPTAPENRRVTFVNVKQ